MRRSLFNRIIMITTAAALLVSAAGCGKKEASVEPSTTKQDSIKETGSPTEETTEEETVINHIPEGDRSWIYDDFYTEEEMAAMQFTVDGKKYGYDEFIEVTNTKFACWRDYYELELDKLERLCAYTNVPESEWSDLWKNTVYPKLQDEDDAKKIYKQISEDAVQMVAGLAQDDNGLISKGKTSGYSAYIFDDGTDVGRLCITDEDALATDTKGVVTNAQCVDITFKADDPNAFVRTVVAYTFITTDPLGESYDIEAYIPISFVYIESEDKWMAYQIGEPMGYYTVYEKDGELASTVLSLDDELPATEGDKYVVLEGPEYTFNSFSREEVYGDHIYWYIDGTNSN